jgi:hypothetical protein
MSRSSTTTSLPSRLASAIICASRSINSVRFGRLVSGSCLDIGRRHDPFLVRIRLSHVVWITISMFVALAALLVTVAVIGLNAVQESARRLQAERLPMKRQRQQKNRRRPSPRSANRSSWSPRVLRFKPTSCPYRDGHYSATSRYSQPPGRCRADGLSASSRQSAGHTRNASSSCLGRGERLAPEDPNGVE